MNKTEQTITVGSKDADLVGNTSSPIQSAIDSLAESGGIVQLLPELYTINAPIRLKSNVTLSGAGNDTVLRIAQPFASALMQDADIGEKYVLPVDSSGFAADTGIIIRDKTKPNSIATMPLTITRIADGKLFLNDWITHDWCAENEGLAISYFPLIHAFEVENIAICNLTLDGAVNNTLPELEGFWGANLYCRRSNGIKIENVHSQNALGDGLRFGQCKNVLLKDCISKNNTHYGIHPGSHTKRVKIRKCDIHHNGSDGLYICWGVQNSVFADNKIHHNGHIFHRAGISIGHKDTDNVIDNNHIFENHKHGIHVRKKTEANGAHRNIFSNNIIENNGTEMSEVPAFLKENLPEQELKGCGIYINGITEDLIFKNNKICETRKDSEKLQKTGIFIAEDVRNISLINNIVEGHPEGDVIDMSGQKIDKVRDEEKTGLC